MRQYKNRNLKVCVSFSDKPRFIKHNAVVKPLFDVTKYMLLIAILFFANNSFACVFSDGDSVKVKIVTWNIQMLPKNIDIFSPSLRKMQKERAPWIIEYCKDLDSDIIVFQEVFDRKINRMLKKQLKDTYPFQVDPRGKAFRFASNGILIVSRIPIKYIDHVIYTRGVHADAMAAKGCTLVEAEKDGAKFQIAGTHLQAGNSEGARNERRKQFLKIRNLLDRNLDERMPVFVVGDMNTRKSDDKKYQEMIDLIGVIDYPIDDTLPYTIDSNNFWNPDSEQSQLDYIFLQARNTASKIFNQYIIRPWRQHKGRKIDLADHYGIVAEINVVNQD